MSEEPNVNQDNTGGQPQQPAPPTQPVPPVQPATPQVQPAQPQQPYGQQPYDQQQAYGQQQPYGYQQPAPNAPGKGKAVGALVCGILSILFSFLPLIGIILGIVAIVLASGYVKSFGKDGKATGGKATGIAGIVLSVLVTIAYVAFSAFIFSVIEQSSSLSGSSATSIEEVISGSSSDEQAVKDVVSEQLDAMMNPNSDIIEAIASGVEEGFVTSSGLTSISDIGLTSQEMAEWIVEGFTYEIDDVYTYDDGTATVFCTVTCKDFSEFQYLFIEIVDEYVASGDIESLTDEAQVNAKIGELLKEAMNQTPMTERFTSLELEKIGSTWQLTDSSGEDFASDIFGYY